jgi:hypothetical protein
VPRVLPDLTFLRVSALPTPASAYEGQVRRTVAGLFWSDGADWRRIDAPGVFWPVTQAEYDELEPEEKDDPAVLWVIVDDATGLRPTTTWQEVSEAPSSPDPGTLYVVVT